MKSLGGTLCVFSVTKTTVIQNAILIIARITFAKSVTTTVIATVTTTATVIGSATVTATSVATTSAAATKTAGAKSAQNHLAAGHQGQIVTGFADVTQFADAHNKNLATSQTAFA